MLVKRIYQGRQEIESMPLEGRAWFNCFSTLVDVFKDRGGAKTKPKQSSTKFKRETTDYDQMSQAVYSLWYPREMCCLLD